MNRPCSTHPAVTAYRTIAAGFFLLLGLLSAILAFRVLLGPGGSALSSGWLVTWRIWLVVAAINLALSWLRLTAHRAVLGALATLTVLQGAIWAFASASGYPFGRMTWGPGCGSRWLGTVPWDWVLLQAVLLASVMAAAFTRGKDGRGGNGLRILLVTTLFSLLVQVVTLPVLARLPGLVQWRSGARPDQLPFAFWLAWPAIALASAGVFLLMLPNRRGAPGRTGRPDPTAGLILNLFLLITAVLALRAGQPMLGALAVCLALAVHLPSPHPRKPNG